MNLSGRLRKLEAARAVAEAADDRCTCGPGPYRVLAVSADGEPVPDVPGRCHRCGGRVTVCRVIEEVIDWADLGKTPPGPP